MRIDITARLVSYETRDPHLIGLLFEAREEITKLRGERDELLGMCRQSLTMVKDVAEAATNAVSAGG